ncbi:MAG: hypothetical protein H7A37_06990 [Chlamydiales bacterium]|nr:hypothetical protein [Chlamydiales bacterium]
MVNHAVKVDHAAARVFAVLGALALDLVTLPIRFLTAPFRAAFADKKEDHELYKLLFNGIDDNIIITDDVKIELIKYSPSNEIFIIMNNNEMYAPTMQHCKQFDLSFIAAPSTYNSNLVEETCESLIVEKVENNEYIDSIISIINVPINLLKNANEIKITVSSNNQNTTVNKKTIQLFSNAVITEDQFKQVLNKCYNEAKNEQNMTDDDIKYIFEKTDRDNNKSTFVLGY